MTTGDDRGRIVLGAVTWLRVALVPVIISLIVIGPDVDGAFVAACILFTIAALTDLLDGYLARRWSFSTRLGTFLDTTADKLLVSGTLLALVEVGRTTAWIAFIIIGREILVLGLKGAVAAGGAPADPSMWGKVKANVQFFAIGMAVVTLGPQIGPLPLHRWAMLAAAAISVISALDYLVRFRGAFDD